jgi:predicted TIM-barrel enzyme
MSKFNTGNIKVDNQKSIRFIDKYKNEHIIHWDNDEERFILDDIVRADGYINATNAHIDNHAPMSSDIDYIVPTLWIDTSDSKVYILKSVENGIATWDILTTGQTGVIDERIFINAGGPINEPDNPQAYYMWVEMPE